MHVQLYWDLYLPVYEDATTAIKPLLDELVSRGKVAQEVFIFDVVHLHNHVFEGAEQTLIQRHTQHR